MVVELDNVDMYSCMPSLADMRMFNQHETVLSPTDRLNITQHRPICDVPSMADMRNYPVYRMRQFLRQCHYINEPNADDDGSEAVRHMEHGAFDRLATLDDGYASAYNMLSILLWFNGGSDDADSHFWAFIRANAFDTELPQWQSDGILEDYDGPVSVVCSGSISN